MYIKITLLSLPFLVSTFHHTAAYALFTESSPSHFRVLSQNSRICSTKTKPALFSSRGQSDESNEHDEFPPKKSNASMEQNTTLNSLGHLLRPSSNCRVDQLSPTALAYIGDSVFELFIRSRYVWPNRRTSDLQNKVVGIVRAESQSKILAELLSPTSPIILNSKELSILKRGRNTGGSGSRKKPKGPKRFLKEDGSTMDGVTTYQDSTAFEALLGYLYISDCDRCFQIMEWITTQLD